MSGKTSLDEYADSITSYTKLEEDAEKIFRRYASTARVEELRQKRAQALRLNPNAPILEGDMVLENAILFLRDSLLSREFADAIKCGDSGRVFLVLKVWALSFRGSGRSKYAYEMLHIIHNFTNVWPKPVW